MNVNLSNLRRLRPTRQGGVTYPHAPVARPHLRPEHNALKHIFSQQKEDIRTRPAPSPVVREHADSFSGFGVLGAGKTRAYNTRSRNKHFTSRQNCIQHSFTRFCVGAQNLVHMVAHTRTNLVQVQFKLQRVLPIGCTIFATLQPIQHGYNRSMLTAGSDAARCQNSRLLRRSSGFSCCMIPVYPMSACMGTPRSL